MEILFYKGKNLKCYFIIIIQLLIESLIFKLLLNNFYIVLFIKESNLKF
jgi:hypothetical protein